MALADDLWNRAALEAGGPAPGPGDLALAAVLRFHSAAMSGGVLDAVETMTDEELDAAEAGYRWLGAAAASELIAAVRREVADGALDDAQRASALELSSDDRYDAVIEDDAALEAVFRAKLESHPDAFAEV